MMILLALYQKIVLSEDDLQEVTTQETNKILDAFKPYTVKGVTEH